MTPKLTLKLTKPHDDDPLDELGNWADGTVALDQALGASATAVPARIQTQLQSASLPPQPTDARPRGPPRATAGYARARLQQLLATDTADAASSPLAVDATSVPRARPVPRHAHVVVAPSAI